MKDVASVIEQLRQEASAAHSSLGAYKVEMEGLPAKIKAAEAKAYSGPEEGIEAALKEKQDLLARQEALDILIFRIEESILDNSMKQAQEELKPLPALEEEAINAEASAQEALTAAQKRFEEAQARRRQIEHNRTSLLRELEKRQNAFYQHRNEHAKKARTNG